MFPHGKGLAKRNLLIASGQVAQELAVFFKHDQLPQIPMTPPF